jgi:1-acyl-sn-glycerol-3-phosphate acyltransferase
MVDTSLGDVAQTRRDRRVEPRDAGHIGRWYWATRRVSWPLRRLWLRIRIEGAENAPISGGVLLAANHVSFLDSLVLMYSLPRQVTCLGKVEYLSSWHTRQLFPAAGMIPVDRSGRGVARSLGVAADRLRSGEIVGIFPEGTRSRDGSLHRGHSGVAHLALRSGAPIVPVGIVGTDAALPIGSSRPRRGAVITIRFGSPIDLGRWAGQGSTSAVKSEITDEVMAAIAVLSGQTMADDHAPVSDPVGAV